MLDIFNIPEVAKVERDLGGNWFTELKTGGKAKRFKNDDEKLKAVLSNPAVLKVFKLQCDLFSLGKVVAYKDRKIVDKDPILDLLDYPNPFQSQRQFLWDYMFWTMLGTSYFYSNSRLVDEDTKMYFLMPNRFEWTSELIQKIDKVVISNKTFEEIEDLQVEYLNLDGTKTKFQLKEIKPLFDLSNGVGHWYRGDSTIDSLYKVIHNSELNLDAKGINMFFAGKFMVNGTHKASDQFGVPMSDTEQSSAKSSILGNDTLNVIKSSVEIKRYVDNLGAIKLDEQYWSDYMIIGGMYGIPRELLEAYGQKNSTWDNQEKARGGHVEQGLQPKGSDLMDTIERYFGYDKKDIDLRITWDHLSFMQVFRKMKNENIKLELENLRLAFDMGVITQEELTEQSKILFNE